MTEFVLEILDGDRVGEIFELSAEPMTFGRRNGNTVVLNDEKCSGRHATIVQEDGQWVLRDLDSTNGTLLDGRRVDEVGLTANDIFQLGVTQVAFKEKGAPTPRNDLSVKKVDEATLARSKRGGGGIGMLLILVLLLGGAAGWYFFLRGGENRVGPVGNRAKAPVRVVGNQLKAGDFEDEETVVFSQVSGLGFDLAFGAAGANSGSRYLLAARGEEATDDHGLARSTRITVSSIGGVKVRAFLMTTGGATACLRVRFTSSNDEQPHLLFTGTAPKEYEKFTEVALDVGVPDGCDRVEVELLGFLTTAEGSSVSADDVSLVSDHSPGGGEKKIQTSVGQRVTWTGGALQIDDGQNSLLLGVRPTTSDKSLSILSEKGLLCLSDIGVQLSVADDSGSILLKTSGGSGTGLVLRFEPGIAASGVLTRKGDAPFANKGQAFHETDVDSLLLGYKSERFMIRLHKPGEAMAVLTARAFELTLSDPSEFRLVYDFGKQRIEARGLFREARQLFGESRFKGALDKLKILLDTKPHDDSVAGEAAVLRTRIRNQLGDAVSRLETEMDEAVYFGSLRVYRRIQLQLSSLVESYGREHLLQPKKVAAMETRVAGSIAAIESELSEEVRAKLEVLARIYGDSDKLLGELINGYLAKFHPVKKDPPPVDNAPPAKTDSDKENH